jgi:iron complex outermembrane recepter protein
MTISKARFARSAAVAAALIYVSPALAQEAQQSNDDSGALGEIVVTAQKRSESAQRIPVTVQALSGEMLERTGSKDLLQAVRAVPGVIFSRAPDDGLALTFRGLGTISRSQAFDLAQALFVDGTFMGKSRLYTTSFFDVDRMEFIKGTQSTLLGKNASLGAISVITKQPGDELSFEGRAGAEVVNGGYTLDGAGDVPLSSSASLRLAGHYNDLNGWVHNDANDHNGPEQRDLGLRATLRVNAGDNLKITGSYQYARNEQLGASYSTISSTLPAVYGSGVLGGNVRQHSSISPTGDTYHDTKSHVASLKAELDIGDHSLIFQSSYVGYKLRYFDDFDFSPEDTVDFVRREKYRHFTQELRLQSPGGRPLEYMVGAFYMTSHWESVEDQLFRVPAFPPPPNPASGQLFNGSFTNNFDQDSKNFSVFASGSYRITPSLRIAGGVRYTHES